MMNAQKRVKEVISKGKKPVLDFSCGLCDTTWKSNVWSVESTSHHGMLLVGINPKEYPVDRCPICSNKSKFIEVKK